MHPRHWVSTALLMLGMFFGVSARAETLVVYSTVAAKGALELIAPEFERAHGHTVRLRLGTAAELKAELEKGAPFDVALLTQAALEDLIKQSRVSAASKVLVFQSGVGAAVRKDATKVKIDTPEDLKSLLLSVRTVALSTQGASGPIVRRAFDRLGIAAAMAPKLVLISDMTAPEAVVKGRAELAFTQISEILDTPEAQLLGPLPGDLQSLSSFSAGAASQASSSAAAALFLKTLTQPSAQSHMRAKGLIPPAATEPTRPAMTSEATPKPDPSRIALVVHGGSGNVTPRSVPPAMAEQYKQGLERALKAGHAVLAQGGSSVDAVVAAIKVMEDDPLFNAGKGAVFTAEGRNELDAAIMDGRTGKAGAVAGVTTVKNPITAARAVMDRTRHVMLSGVGADAFAAEQKLEIVPPSYFHTPHRWEQLQRARETGRLQLDHDGTPRRSSAAPDSTKPWQIDHKYGTVGAVALDAHGNLAAGTSTGGLTNKLYGRIGDSPIIGAGTYAGNSTVAVSATGTGEFFMRGVVAYDIAARMKYAGLSVAEAVDRSLREALTEQQGRGGVIALSRAGEVKMGFNTEGMHRGVVRADGVPMVRSFAD